ncbi:MAG: DUF3365 domain-containing protein [Xanthomonadales bacterium]|nr:DUF3365 domain-containing protein [Gammaproteobacteria bacterium]MBT8053894.1 DUF3365 domain-containing protein [Gammaproteobacteria bacterium]NNK52054.1 DUF3365 domain-containing protein [Xanthomonadales bacterium]
MKKTFLALACASLIPAVSAGFDQTDEVARAKQAVAGFSAALKSELMAAMQSGGALRAIEVCHTRAAEISEEVSLETGMSLFRVSQQNRSPSNVPNDWQTAVLQDFKSRILAGEEAASLSWYAQAETADGPEFRFMKAIPTGGLCLQCHGTQIAPEVADKLSEIYPQDKATGFKPGDLRGAFVVTSRVD